MSLEAQPAAANPNVSEDRFEGLWNAGAFNADGKPDPKQGQVAPAAAPGAAPAADPDPAEPPPVAQSPQGAAAPEEEGPDYANLDDYLQKANVERESFLALPVTVKIDGQTKLVPLQDVLKSYQLEGHVNNKSIALAEQQRAFEADRQAAQQAIGQQLQMAHTLGNLAHQQLLGEFQQIDWNALRANDPARWAVLNTEFQQRANAIAAHVNQVQQLQQQQAAQQQEAVRAQLPKAREQMLEARPEWRDEKQFQAARTEMTSYARKMGITDAELSGIFDHRYMLILHDAARFAQLQASSPAALKRVRAAPQVAQPGARQSRDPQAVARQQLAERVKKNPRDQDAQAAYFATLS